MIIIIDDHFCFRRFGRFLRLSVESSVTVIWFRLDSCVHAKYELIRMLYDSFMSKNTIMMIIIIMIIIMISIIDDDHHR